MSANIASVPDLGNRDANAWREERWEGSAGASCGARAPTSGASRRLPAGNEELLLRGNSVATKAIEAYIKIVGETVTPPLFARCAH